MKHDITLTVNGDAYRLAVDPWRTLNEVLREDLNQAGLRLGRLRRLHGDGRRKKRQLLPNTGR